MGKHPDNWSDRSGKSQQAKDRSAKRAAEQRDDKRIGESRNHHDSRVGGGANNTGRRK